MAKDKAKIKVAKMNLHPADEPTSYAVGFSVHVKGRSFYRDTTVSLDQCNGKTEQEIVDMAYEQLRDGIESQATVLEEKSELIGKEYTPKAKVIAEPTPTV